MRAVIAFSFAIFFFTSGLLADDKKDVLDIATRIKNKYGITVSVTKTFELNDISSTIAKSDNDWADLLRYAHLLSDELKKYTPSFIRSLGLTRIMIVKELSKDTKSYSVIAVPKYDMLLLDFQRGMFKKKFQRHVFHHQIFLYAQNKFAEYGYIKDKKWAKLRPAKFEYGSDSTLLISEPGMDELSYPYKGIINTYATKGLLEDQAEIFTAIMMIEHYKDFANMMQFDPKLRTKVAMMKKFILKLSKGMREHYLSKVVLI